MASVMTAIIFSAHIFNYAACRWLMSVCLLINWGVRLTESGEIYLYA